MKIKVVMTSLACPEQYDVFNEKGKQIAYFRLRHGWFRVDTPQCGDKTIYEGYPKGDGMFATVWERNRFFKRAFKAMEQELGITIDDVAITHY